MANGQLPNAASSSDAASSADGATRAAALDYIEALLAQLHTMADGHDLDMLAYLIEMAWIEASDAAQRERLPPGTRDQRRTRA